MSTQLPAPPTHDTSAPPRHPLFADGAITARPIALVFRIIAFALIVTGVTRNADLLSGDPQWSSLLFFTMISNLICLVWMVLLIIRTLRDLRRSGRSGTSTPSPRWSGAVMMAITVTMLIYVVILVPTRISDGDTDIYSLTDSLIHVITPLLLILDWLLFVPKGRFRWIDPLLWTLIPYAYLVFAFVFGALGGEFFPGNPYPYPFMNLDTLGLGGVALWVLGLSIALIAVGYVYVGIDRLLAAVGRRTTPARRALP